MLRSDEASGNTIRQHVPAPAWVLTEILPPSSRTSACTADMPTPRPEIAVTLDLVLKPSLKRANASSLSLS